MAEFQPALPLADPVNNWGDLYVPSRVAEDMHYGPFGVLGILASRRRRYRNTVAAGDAAITAAEGCARDRAPIVEMGHALTVQEAESVVWYAFRHGCTHNRLPDDPDMLGALMIERALSDMAQVGEQ